MGGSRRLGWGNRWQDRQGYSPSQKKMNMFTEMACSFEFKAVFVVPSLARKMLNFRLKW